jgi:hypothetical protein
MHRQPSLPERRREEKSFSRPIKPTRIDLWVHSRG